MRQQVTISLDRDLLDKLDEKRGLINRSVYIEDLIRKELEK